MENKKQVVVRTYPPDDTTDVNLEAYLEKGYNVVMCNQMPYLNKTGYCLEYILEK